MPLRENGHAKAWFIWFLHDVAMKHKAFTAHFPSGNDGFEGTCSTCREKTICINMLINTYMSL